MKKIMVLILITINLFSWEINTHRAIGHAKNLTNFLQGGEHDYLGMADGRFVNHFEDGQTSKGLSVVKALIYTKKGKTTC